MSTPTETDTDTGTDTDGNTGQDSGVHLSGNTFAGDVWANFKRWTIKAVRNRFFLFLTLIQPIIFLVLFTQVFGQVATDAISSGGNSISYTTYLVPAIAVQVALAAAASSGIGLVNDMEDGLFEKVLASPMNRTAVFLGKTCSELLLILVQIGIILVLGTLLGARIATGFAGAVGIMFVGLVFSIWFVSLSNILAVITRDQETTALGANMIQFPLLFISTAFLPLDVLPGWIQAVATVNPITYGVDASRAL
ncbi:MAG: ABC transporter permease, partial [Halobacteria archaeon]|nr:ABC transporter permease [Halobacteria archaeon]